MCLVVVLDVDTNSTKMNAVAAFDAIDEKDHAKYSAFCVFVLATVFIVLFTKVSLSLRANMFVNVRLHLGH